jgi:hypothetical protein
MNPISTPQAQRPEDEMDKNAIISARILAHVANGMTIDQAYDAVFGEGAYLKLAGELYDALRAK